MWRELVEADLLTGITKPELIAIKSKLLADGQANPIPIVISQVTAEFREAIRSCATNQLSLNAAYLPESSIRHAVAIIRHRLMSRFSDDHDAGEDRRMEYREANRYLISVAECKLSVERDGVIPDTPLQLNKPLIKPSARVMSRQDQDGI